MSSLQHECPKHQCSCSKEHELSKLYRDLKCQHKRAKENNDGDERGECISSKELQITQSQAEHVLDIVRKQREGVRNLMTSLRAFSQKLRKQEEMICQTDKEITELQDEMRRIKEQYENKQVATNNECDAISDEEITWRKAIDLEIREQCRLKDKIKQLTECLESRKKSERAIDLERQEERKTDAKLLLNAMDYVERCIQDKETM